jgi:hypothetical protein
MVESSFGHNEAPIQGSFIVILEHCHVQGLGRTQNHMLTSSHHFSSTLALAGNELIFILLCPITALYYYPFFEKIKDKAVIRRKATSRRQVR